MLTHLDNVDWQRSHMVAFRLYIKNYIMWGKKPYKVRKRGENFSFTNDTQLHENYCYLPVNISLTALSGHFHDDHSGHKRFTPWCQTVLKSQSSNITHIYENNMFYPLTWVGWGSVPRSLRTPRIRELCQFKAAPPRAPVPIRASAQKRTHHLCSCFIRRHSSQDPTQLPEDLETRGEQKDYSVSVSATATISQTQQNRCSRSGTIFATIPPTISRRKIRA